MFAFTAKRLYRCETHADGTSNPADVVFTVEKQNNGLDTPSPSFATTDMATYIINMSCDASWLAKFLPGIITLQLQLQYKYL